MCRLSLASAVLMTVMMGLAPAAYAQPGLSPRATSAAIVRDSHVMCELVDREWRVMPDGECLRDHVIDFENQAEQIARGLRNGHSPESLLRLTNRAEETLAVLSAKLEQVAPPAYGPRPYGGHWHGGGALPQLVQLQQVTQQALARVDQLELELTRGGCNPVGPVGPSYPPVYDSPTYPTLPAPSYGVPSYNAPTYSTPSYSVPSYSTPEYVVPQPSVTYPQPVTVIPARPVKPYPVHYGPRFSKAPQPQLNFSISVRK